MAREPARPEPQRWAVLAARHFTAGGIDARCAVRVAMVAPGQVAEAVCRWTLDPEDLVSDDAKRQLCAQRQRLVNELQRQMGRRIEARDVWC